MKTTHKVYRLNLPHYTGDVILTFDRYRMDNSLAIQMYDAQSHEPIARPTVCALGTNLEPEEVCIKSWSENEGMMEELMRLNIIGPSKREVICGYELASIHDCLIPAEERM